MAEAAYYRGEWQKELALRQEYEARAKQLEDELSVARAEIQTAYEYVKPPVNIDTSTKTIVDSGGGGVDLPDPAGKAAQSQVWAVVAVVLGVVGVLLTVWLMFKRGKG